MALKGLTLCVAAFLAPVIVLKAISGGFCLQGIKGKVTEMPVPLASDASLDLAAPDLEAAVPQFLAAEGSVYGGPAAPRGSLPGHDGFISIPRPNEAASPPDDMLHGTSPPSAPRLTHWRNPWILISLLRLDALDSPDKRRD